MRDNLGKDRVSIQCHVLRKIRIKFQKKIISVQSFAGLIAFQAIYSKWIGKR